MTHDILCWMNILSKFQLPSCSDLGMRLFRRDLIKGLLSHLINYEGDCRTAPATSGLAPSLHQALITYYSQVLKAQYFLHGSESAVTVTHFLGGFDATKPFSQKYLKNDCFIYFKSIRELLL